MTKVVFGHVVTAGPKTFTKLIPWATRLLISTVPLTTSTKGRNGASPRPLVGPALMRPMEDIMAQFRIEANGVEMGIYTATDEEEAIRPM